MRPQVVGFVCGSMSIQLALIHTMAELKHRGVIVRMYLPNDAQWLIDLLGLQAEAFIIPVNLRQESHDHELYESGMNLIKTLRSSQLLLDVFMEPVVQQIANDINSGEVLPKDTLLLTNDVGLFHAGSFLQKVGFASFVSISHILFADLTDSWQGQSSTYLSGDSYTQCLLGRAIYGGRSESIADKHNISMPYKSSFKRLQKQLHYQFIMQSPQVLQMPDSEKFSVVGQPYYPIKAAPPKQVAKFLAKDDMPAALLTLGTVKLADEKLVNLIATYHQVAKNLGLKIIFQGINGKSDKHLLFYNSGFAHSSILSKLSLVISHGGSGTVHSALREGLPQIIHPILGDQLQAAKKYQELGLVAGIRSLPEFNELPLHQSVEKVSRFVRIALNSTSAHTKRLAEVEKTSHANGIYEVASRIEQLL